MPAAKLHTIFAYRKSWKAFKARNAGPAPKDRNDGRVHFQRSVRCGATANPLLRRELHPLMRGSQCPGRLCRGDRDKLPRIPQFGQAWADAMKTSECIGPAK